MIADLHIHTTASDGRFSPIEILNYAKLANLSYIAITDHDTVSGVMSLEDIIPDAVTVIPGIEFSTDYAEHEIHILGYNIDIHDADLQQKLITLTIDRKDRLVKMINKLHNLGYSIEHQRVLEIAKDASAIGRPHVAKALVEKGYFESVSQTFEFVIGKNGPAYVPHFKLSVEQVLETVKNAGGRAVLAHPGLIQSDVLVDWIISLGIDGIEVYHPAHSDEDEIKYKKLAERHNLIVTGGSDFHGIPGRYPEKLGDFSISADLAIKLLNAQA